jgi:hypothetical protein
MFFGVVEKGNAMNFDREKFTALVHYVCHKADDPTVLGAVKLNKVLWYSDVVHYTVTGESITGETYVKRQRGPVPRHVMQAIDALVSVGKVARGKVDHYGFMKNEYISLREPDLSLFSPDEIARVDESFEHVCLNHTARSISEETHGVIWQLAEIGEEMPYSTVFASVDGEVDENDVAWAQQRIIERHPELANAA